MSSIIKNVGYSYNDLTIVPAAFSCISSRSECNPYVHDNMLPIFTAPMSSVVNEDNFYLWKSNGITPIMPRNVGIDTRITYMNNGEWVAFSLNEFVELFIETKLKSPFENGKTYHVCVDLANGHMAKLYDFISKAKEIASKEGYKLDVMTGNIANPETYNALYASNVDYIRLSIGSGNGCLTTSNTGIHYPIASLIDECNSIRIYRNERYPFIVADGGIRNFSDAIKALALGADYVMIGGLFSSFIESAAEFEDVELLRKVKNEKRLTFYHSVKHQMMSTVIYDNSDESETVKREFLDNCKYRNIGIYKLFYGMSTKKAQREISGNDTNLKTSEGCEKRVEVKYTMRQWIDNFISYLKSAMSYTNSVTLDDFRKNTVLIVNSANEIISVNK